MIDKRSGGLETFAPAGRPVCPLPHALEVSELVTGDHHLAINVACPLGRQPIGYGCDHRLVEEAHSLVDTALLDQGLALLQDAEGDNVEVAESAPSCLHRPCLLDGAPEVTGG